MTTLIHVQRKTKLFAFLNTKIKNREEDPDERWILLGMIIYGESNIAIDG